MAYVHFCSLKYKGDDNLDVLDYVFLGNAPSSAILTKVNTAKLKFRYLRKYLVEGKVSSRSMQRI